MKCTTPCIYYHEVFDQFQKPSVKIVCDYREGEEIKNIPLDTIHNCQAFKSYKDIKWKIKS